MHNVLQKIYSQPIYANFRNHVGIIIFCHAIVKNIVIGELQNFHKRKNNRKHNQFLFFTIHLIRDKIKKKNLPAKNFVKNR